MSDCRLTIVDLKITSTFDNRRIVNAVLLSCLLVANGAEQQFDEVVRLAPPDAVDESAAKAHYSLGIMREEKGQRADALAHLTAAVKYQPNDVEADLALADALRRGGGRMKEALAQYQEALSINPRSTPCAPAGRRA